MTEKYALFLSCDGEPKFYVVLCNPNADALKEALREHVYDNSDLAEHLEQIAEEAAVLTERGSFDYGDGWARLCVGVEAVSQFLMEKLKEQCEETAFEASGVREERAKAQAATHSYTQLRNALRDALGDKGPEIAAKAA